MTVQSLVATRHAASSVVALLACICSGSNEAQGRAPSRFGSYGQTSNFSFVAPRRALIGKSVTATVASDERPKRPATTLTVTNCDDSGSGSLRDTIASAVSGDTVDLTHLTCSAVTLTSNYLTVAQDDLTIVGPGAASLSIDGGGALPLIAHYGSGTLSISGLALKNGYYYYHGTQRYATGGCVVSLGNVTFQDSVISNCKIKGAGRAQGGAVWTAGNLTLITSVITHSQAEGVYQGGSGAAYVYGDLALEYSTVSDNAALSATPYALAGAFLVRGNVNIQNSTVSGNQAQALGAFEFSSHGNSPTALISNSTISGNVASNNAFGGGYSSVPLTIYNSTVAFNRGETFGGIYIKNAPLVVQSTIIADNVGIDLKLGGTSTVSGSNNLIYNAPLVPPDTIRACPQLDSLADNGGVTLTHALLSTSPAIDTGGNIDAFSYDQRGTGFPRLVGDSVDIGAFEWQRDGDAVFRSGFEAGCDE